MCDADHPYRWRTWLRFQLPWFLINLGLCAKARDCEAVGAATAGTTSTANLVAAITAASCGPASFRRRAALAGVARREAGNGVETMDEVLTLPAPSGRGQRPLASVRASMVRSPFTIVETSLLRATAFAYTAAVVAPSPGRVNSRRQSRPVARDGNDILSGLVHEAPGSVSVSATSSSIDRPTRTSAPGALDGGTIPLSRM